MSVLIGTHIAPEVNHVFQEMKARSLHKYIIAKITDDWSTIKLDYPPKPSPALRLASHMLEVAKAQGKKKGGEVDNGSHESDHESAEEAEAHSIGPELAVLPPEIFTHILKFCPSKSLFALASVSKYWHDRVTYDRDLWQKIYDDERARLGMGWNQSWEDMVAKLPADDCRLVVFMWERSPNRHQPLFIIWAPELSRIRAKMVYCSTAYTFKKSLDLAAEVQATSFDELTASVVEDALARTYGGEPLLQIQ